MDRNTYFDNLHKEIGAKYNIAPHHVQSLRFYALFRKFDKEQTIKRTIERLDIDNEPKSKARLRRAERLAILSKLTQEELNDICRKTEHDRS